MADKGGDLLLDYGDQVLADQEVDQEGQEAQLLQPGLRFLQAALEPLKLYPLLVQRLLRDIQLLALHPRLHAVHHLVGVLPNLHTKMPDNVTSEGITHGKRQNEKEH